MKGRSAPLAVALVAVALGPARAQHARTGADRSGLQALYQGVLDAVRRHDTTALKPLLADSYLFTDGTTGTLLTKPERLRAVAQGTDTIDALLIDSLTLRRARDVAVASVLVRQVGTHAGKQSTELIRATVVFLRSPGPGWQVAATHTSVGHEPGPR